MGRTLLLTLLGLLLLIPVNTVAESSIPDMKGTWLLTAETTKRTKITEPNPKAHFSSGMVEFEGKLIIDNQKGARFTAVFESGGTKESILGVIGFDNRSIYWVDDDGYLFAQLVSPDKMEVVYLHTGKYDAVASRGVYIRQK